MPSYIIEFAKRIQKQNIEYFGLFFIIIVAILLRLNRLGHYSLWLDETIQYAGSTYSLPRLYASIFPQEMPLSFFLGKLQNAMGLDRSVFVLRLGSVVSGVALVIVMYFTARRLFDIPNAILTALLIVGAPCLIQYSQEYRMYASFALFANVAGLCIIKFVEKPTATGVCLFLCFSLLTIYDHFLGVIAVATLLLYGGILGIAQVRRKPAVLAGTISAGFVILVGMVLTIPMWARFLGDEYVVDQGTLLNVSALKQIFGAYIGIGDGALFWAFLTLATIGLVASWLRAPRAGLYMTLFIFVPLCALSIRGSGRVLISNRYLLFMEPVYLMACAGGLSSICRVAAIWFGQRWLKFMNGAAAFFAGALLISPLAYLYSHNVKPQGVDLRSAYQHVVAGLDSKSVIIEASTTRGGSPYFFGFYNSYFLRGRVVDVNVLDTINLPPWLNIIDGAGRRTWFLLTVDQKEQQRIEDMGDVGFSKVCYTLICGFTIESVPTSVRDQTLAFIKAYGELDPSFDKIGAAIKPVARQP